MTNQVKKIKEYTYYVAGMHCASCEILIEKRLLEEEGVEGVEASVNKNEVRIEHKNSKPSIDKLNKIFQKNGYMFSEKTFKDKDYPLFQFDKQGKILINKEKFYNLLTIVGVSLLVVIFFFFLNKSGLSAAISVNSQSSLPVFLLFGLLAGFSTCSALVGGIILSMSKQWSELYSSKNSFSEKLRPHLLFNTGRLIAYILFGSLLGVLGSMLQVSPLFTSVLTLGVSVMMILLSLQMLGVKAFVKFQLTTPKTVTRFVADESNFKGKFMPFLLGALTFFLPCGFTITAQGLALTSGSPLQAALIMFLFCLGTLPALLLIGFSSVKFNQKPHFVNQFLKVAGVLVLFFALYHINSQLNVLGFTSLSDLTFGSSQILKNGLPPIINGKQVLKTDALAFGYDPNRLKVKVGIPVRWEITDKGTSGCTNAIISRGLFDGQIDLTPGKTSIKEFTPKRVGRYKFSCWMGMVSGIIDVVDPNAKSELTQDGSTADLDDVNNTIDSGARGCEGAGGGCGGRCGGGCGNPKCPYANVPPSDK